jgi:hypothetical protein
VEKIARKMTLNVSPEKAYDTFLNALNEWWPKEYTWSQAQLREIKIDARKDGLCTEIGPHGFRCDWGRVSELVKNEHIGLKWQISPKREPIPDPAKASDLQVRFARHADATMMEFEHYNFENHGEGAKNYRDMMDSEYGWDYILNNFKVHCEK